MLVNFSYSMEKNGTLPSAIEDLRVFLSTLRMKCVLPICGLCLFLTIFVYVCLLFRDYTNPYLPVAPSAIDGAGQVK